MTEIPGASTPPALSTGSKPAAPEVKSPVAPKPQSKAQIAAAERLRAEAKVEAAKRLLQEAECELKVGWEPGAAKTLAFDVPQPQFGAVPRTNGKALCGARKELTYDEMQEVAARMSLRADHESKQRFGYHEGEKYIKVQGGQGKSVKLSL